MQEKSRGLTRAAFLAIGIVIVNSCAQSTPIEMTGLEFCRYVVDPQFASQTKIRLENLANGKYEFLVVRPRSKALAIVLASELRFSSDFTAEPPFPKDIPYEKIRLSSRNTAKGTCRGWFP